MPGYVEWLRESSGNSPNDAALSLLSYIADSLDEAVVGLDADGLVVLWNLAAEESFGFRTSQVRGLSLLELIPLDYRDEVGDLLERIRDTGRGYEWVGGMLARGVGSVRASLSFYPVNGSDGGVIGLTVVAHRLTDPVTGGLDDGFRITGQELEQAIDEILSDPVALDDRDPLERGDGLGHDEDFQGDAASPLERTLESSPMHRYPWTGSALFSTN